MVGMPFGAVPCRPNGLCERFGGGPRGIERHERFFRHQVDGGVRDAGLLGQRGLNADLARSARHACDRNMDLLHEYPRAAFR